MDWKSHAARLASEVTHPVSRWRPVIAAIPRHLFVPRWWSWSAAGSGFGSDVWELRDGPADDDGWLRAAYRTGRWSPGSVRCTLTTRGRVIDRRGC